MLLTQKPAFAIFTPSLHRMFQEKISDVFSFWFWSLKTFENMWQIQTELKYIDRCFFHWDTLCVEGVEKHHVCSHASNSFFGDANTAFPSCYMYMSASFGHGIGWFLFPN